MDNRYHRHNRRKYSLKVHIVLVTQYRKQLLKGSMANVLQGSSHRLKAVGFRLRNRKDLIYEICKSYFIKAMKNCELSEDVISSVMDEFKWLLDTVSSTEIKNAIEKKLAN